MQGFSKEEIEKYVAALNFIAEEAKFKGAATVQYSIKLRNHFAHLQEIAGKMSSMKVGEIGEEKKDESKPAPRSRAAGRGKSRK